MGGCARDGSRIKVSLVKQPDKNTCGQASVAMIAKYHGVKVSYPQQDTLLDPIFEELKRDDGRLDSFGISCALLSIFKNGKIFFASDHMDRIVTDEKLKPLGKKTKEQLKELSDSKRVFLCEWFQGKSIETTMTTIAVTKPPFIMVDRKPIRINRTPCLPFVILEEAVNGCYVPCITPVDDLIIKNRVSPERGLHNYVITKMEHSKERDSNGDEIPKIIANSSGDGKPKSEEEGIDIPEVNLKLLGLGLIMT